MRVLYDHQIFDIQNFGGISRYFTEIISNFSSEIKTEIAIAYSDNLYLWEKNLTSNIEHIFNPKDKFLGEVDFRGKGRLFNVIKKFYPERFKEAHHYNKKKSIELLKKKEFDIFHPTYYDDYFLEYLGNKPFVLTIHDLIPELYPELYTGLKELQLSKMKENLANKANHIIAVSQNTKKDIINIFGIKENKISVIYHSTSLHSKEGVIKVPEKFILYVGDRHAGYKNFKFMVRAVSSILKEYKELNVVCLGHDFDVNERELLRNLGVSNRFISMFASEDLISEIYCKALFLLYPSYYEGFGIPILEAFALSCPVLLSDIYCFREIAKDAGFYFNAKDIVDLREKISVLLVDKDIRKRMIVNGLSRSSDFSWIKSTEQTVAVYKNLYERFS